MKGPLNYRNLLFRLIGVFAIAAGAWAFFQLFPIMKLSTPEAFRMIEKQHIRPDLTDKEREHFESCKRVILGNDNLLMHGLKNAALAASIGLPIMGLLLISTIDKRQNQ